MNFEGALMGLFASTIGVILFFILRHLILPKNSHKFFYSISFTLGLLIFVIVDFWNSHNIEKCDNLWNNYLKSEANIDYNIWNKECN